MTENLPQPISDSIVPDLLALNNAHSVELSWLDVDRLKSLLRQAFYARMIGSADAFLLAFDQGASYDSPNERNDRTSGRGNARSVRPHERTE